MFPWGVLVFIAFAVYIICFVIPRVERTERRRWQKRREELWKTWFSNKSDK